MTNLLDYLPQPSNWFSKTLNYTGTGRIELSKPKGWVDGQITCDVNHVGEMTVILEVQDWENYEEPNDPKSVDSRDWLISGIKVTDNLPLRMYVKPQPTNNSIVSMRLQTSDGGSVASDNIPNYKWDPIGNTIKLYVDSVTYTSIDPI